MFPLFEISLLENLGIYFLFPTNNRKTMEYISKCTTDVDHVIHVRN